MRNDGDAYCRQSGDRESHNFSPRQLLGVWHHKERKASMGSCKKWYNNVKLVNGMPKLEDIYLYHIVNWNVIRSKRWQGASDVKAAEFLVEGQVSIPDCLRGVATMTESRAEMVRKLMKMTGVDKPVKASALRSGALRSGALRKCRLRKSWRRSKR